MTAPSPPTRAERIVAAITPAALPIALLGPALVRGTLLYGYDTIGELFPWWSWAWRRIASGEFPHWNPNVLCGVPFHGLAVVSLAYPVSLLNLALDPPRMITLWCLAHLVLAGLFVQRHARALGCTPAAAALAGTTFATSEALLSRITAGELPQLAVVAWIPAALWIVEEALRRRQAARLWLAAVPLAWMLLAGHLQYVAYGSMLVASYAAARILADPATRGRAAWWLGLACIWPLGAALAAHQVLPTLDALRDSHRHLGLAPGGGGILLAPVALLRLLSPDLLGNEYLGSYVGPSVATQMPLYVGMVSLLLAVCAVTSRAPRTRLLAALAIGAVLYGLGDRTPLAPLVRALIPPLGGFRIPSRMLVVGALPLALLAGIGLDTVSTPPAAGGPRGRRPSRTKPLALIGAFAGLVAIASGLPLARAAWLQLTDLAPSADAAARLDSAWATARGSAARSLGYLAIALVSIAAVRRHGAASRWPGWLAIAVATLDLGVHSAPWVRAMPADEASMAADLDPVVAALRDVRPAPLGARVLSEVTIAREPRPASFVRGYGIGAARGEAVPNWLAAHGLRSVTGEIGIIPARTMLFTGNVGRYSLSSIEPASRLDALAVGWVVSAAPALGSDTGSAALVATRRDTALPLVFLSERALPAANATEALEHLDGAPGGTIDPRHEVLVEDLGAGESEHDSPLGTVPPGRATLLFLDDDRLAVAVDARRPTWLVVLEPFVPRWKADVDGTPVTIHPAHVMFRALPVPSGHHVVRMRYVPSPFRIGIGIALLTALGFLVAIAAAERRAFRTLPIASARR